MKMLFDKKDKCVYYVFSTQTPQSYFENRCVTEAVKMRYQLYFVQVNTVFFH